MEKWADAAKVWREAVEAGVGGSISIQGRNRCDKAAGGGNQAAAAQRAPVRRPPPKPSAMSDLGPPKESEAVKKLKAANAAAEKADDEKFALSDSVDAKLVAWKGTKADNLRALLGSLDKVLWPEAGWKKVNMGDLVMANKVKIIYMKAIAKVHPDKVSFCSVIVRHRHANAIADISIRHYRAEDDQCCSFRNTERSLGQVQDGERLIVADHAYCIALFWASRSVDPIDAA
jgi:hypothetical protein